MKELTREELFSFEHHLTVGALKDFLEKHELPNEARVVVQRVKDYYYDTGGWRVYYKEGEHTYSARRWNEDIESGEYPNANTESLNIYTEDEIKETREQYTPAWGCVKYNDDSNILFIDLHY